MNFVFYSVHKLKSWKMFKERKFDSSKILSVHAELEGVKFDFDMLLFGDSPEAAFSALE